jgi:hypothetical protein
MSYTSDYLFQNMSRIGNDNCYLSQRDTQDVNFSNYMLTNYNSCEQMNKVINVATSQPSFFYKGQQNLGLGGCNVDDSSRLLITDLNRSKSKLLLNQRPYLTVPYLGKGAFEPTLESSIQQGEMVTNRKSINTLSEISYKQYDGGYLVPSLKMSVTNPANLVESVAADGWIRGGVPSRELAKDQDYHRK